MNASTLTTVHHRVASSGSPVPSVPSISSIAPQPLHRQLPATQSAAYNSQPTTTGFPQQTQPASMHGSWYSSPSIPTIAAPQASHPLAPPPPPPPPQVQAQRSPPTQSEEWDDTYLSVLSTQDPKQLRELLARSNPEIVMPLSGPGPLSQAVILTLLHRVSKRNPKMNEFLADNSGSSLRLFKRHRRSTKPSSRPCGGSSGQLLY